MIVQTEMEPATTTNATWLWPSSSSSRGASLIDVNIEGEECTCWNVFGVFWQKEAAHLLGTSQGFLLSFLKVYMWSCWTKGSRGSSMKDILELGLFSCRLDSSLYTHGGSAETLTMGVVTIRESRKDVHFPGIFYLLQHLCHVVYSILHSS